MKRSSNSQVKPIADTPSVTSRLEVPYAFGTLIITPFIDPRTNTFTGLLKVSDEERGYCFGMISSNSVNLQAELDNTIKYLSTNKSDKITMSGKQTVEVKKKTKLSRNISEMPCTSKQAEKSDLRQEVKAKRSFEEVDSEIEIEKGSISSKKLCSTPSHPDISCLKLTSSSSELVTKSNSQVSISQLVWGVLNFYSGKNLIYTHYLWGTEPISINVESLRNVKKLNMGVEQIESLADDFRYILGKGFTLQKKKDSNYSKVEIRKAENDSRTFYKVINSDQDIEIKTSEPAIIYDGNTAMTRMEEMVTNFEQGYQLVDSLFAIIVINNIFLRKMGISMERINRNSAESMPYYLVLKMNNEFDSLNSHLLAKLNI